MGRADVSIFGRLVSGALDCGLPLSRGSLADDAARSHLCLTRGVSLCKLEIQALSRARVACRWAAWSTQVRSHGSSAVCCGGRRLAV